LAKGRTSGRVPAVHRGICDRGRICRLHASDVARCWCGDVPSQGRM